VANRIHDCRLLCDGVVGASRTLGYHFIARRAQTPPQSRRERRTIPSDNRLRSRQPLKLLNEVKSRFSSSGDLAGLRSPGPALKEAARPDVLALRHDSAKRNNEFVSTNLGSPV
jgi:hypothetical protein